MSLVSRRFFPQKIVFTTLGFRSCHLEMESLKNKSLRVICKCAYPVIVAALSCEPTAETENDSDNNLNEEDYPQLEKKSKRNTRLERDLEKELQTVAKINEQLDKLGIYGNFLGELLWQEYAQRGGKERPDVYLFLNSILIISVTSLQLNQDHFKTFLYQSENVDSLTCQNPSKSMP